MELMRKLIIGKNSEIVKGISHLIKDVDQISHADVGDVDFSVYGLIFVFSWSRELVDNIRILDHLPPAKVVFISTTAVYSIALRHQWNNYPNDKAFIERLVLERGGRVVRFGVIDRRVKARSPYSYPFTSLKLIADYIQRNHLSASPVEDLFVLRHPRRSIPLSFKLMRALSLQLPPRKYIQIFFDFFFKYFLKLNYGYTLDSCTRFSYKVQIGYGAFGSVFYSNKKNFHENRRLIVSPYPDTLLSNNGFELTRIGRRLTGLSKYWHGAYIVSDGDNYKKSVPFKVDRPKIPRGCYFSEISSVTRTINGYCLKPNDGSAPFFCSQLVLAAGALQNSIYLSRLFEVSIQLSDHEIAYIGTCVTNDAIRMKFLKRVLFFVIRGNLMYLKDREVLVDFRPCVDRTTNDPTLYLDQTKSILFRLFKNFSIFRLNEAFFNKFGFGFYTTRSTLFLQVLNRNCITVNEGRLCRKRFNTVELDDIINCIRLTFPFDRFESVRTVDGQHIWGGVSSGGVLSKFINECSTLKIIGAPCVDAPTALHHTQTYINKLIL